MMKRLLLLALLALSPGLAHAQVACPPGQASVPCLPQAQTLTGSERMWGDQNGTVSIGVQQILNGIGTIPTVTSYSQGQVYASPASAAGPLALRALTSTDLPTIAIPQGGTGATTASGARTNLGLGSAATANASSGTGTVAAVSGGITSGHCAQFNDATGTVSDAGGACTTGGSGSGTVNSGTANQLAYYASSTTAVSGNPQINTPSAGVLDLGANGATAGVLELFGSASGKTTIQTVAAAGTYNWNYPTTAGTSGQPLLSGGGGTAAQTYGTLGIAGGGTGGVTAAAARSNLGLGTSATVNTGTSGATVPLLNGNNVWSSGQSSAPVTITFNATTTTPDFTAGNVQKLTLTANITTLANPSPTPPAGECVVIFLIQDATGNRTITNWGANYKFPGGTKPTLSTGANAIDALTVCTETTTFLAGTFNAGFQ